MGSWKIMEMLLPRMPRISLPPGFMRKRSFSSPVSALNKIWPWVLQFLLLMPKIALQVRLLPQPLSPTRPSVSFSQSEKSTPRTGVSRPSSRRMPMARFFISSTVLLSLICLTPYL